MPCAVIQKDNEVIKILNVLSFRMFFLHKNMLIETITDEYLPLLVKSKEDIQASLKLTIIFSVT